MQQTNTLNPKSNTLQKPKKTDLVARFGKIITILIENDYLTLDQVEYAHRVHQKLETPCNLVATLKDLNYLTDDKIKQAIRENPVTMRIGNLLVELGYITESDLKVVFDIQAREKNKRKIGQILVAQNLIEERRLVEILSLQLNLPFVEPEIARIDKKLFLKAPIHLYDAHKFIPIKIENGYPLIAFADPMDRSDIAEARRIFGSNIKLAIARETAINESIRQLQKITKVSSIKEVDEDSVVGIVNAIIMAAIGSKASDIHIEPMKDRLRVRFRQDGVLFNYKNFPSEVNAAISRRIKIMCEGDITEKRRHQGGRILFDYPEGQLDLRVSFYVTVQGEKVVLRLMRRQNEVFNIKDIGLAPRTFDRFVEQGLELAGGILLITGPTGSGKTSTVYSCINHISSPQVSIITAEEPVEAILDGIAQCSINPKINLTFDETLRHVVRQDPDVIVIGEIRDTFSAKIAVQAALTGHKVLTTFHTEDSVGGLIRLLNMDLEPFLVSSTVIGVLAQRLLRRVCSACRESYAPSVGEIRRLGYSHDDLAAAKFIKGRGCSKCRHTGYLGRIGVFELLIPDESVRSAILAQRTSQAIRKLSIENTDLITLLEDGIAKAATGNTTVEEVIRCLPRLHKPRPLPDLLRLSGMKNYG